MEEKTLQILEFYKVTELLGGFASSEAGRALCAKIRPDTDLKRIRQWQRNTTDAAERIRLKGSAPSFRGVREIRDSLKRLEVEAPLSIPELLSVSSVLTVAERAKAYGRSAAAGTAGAYARGSAEAVKKNICPGEAADGSGRRAGAYQQDQAEREDSLSESFSMLEPLTQLNNELKRCIFSEDEIADDASDGLFRVRRRMKQIDSEIHGSLSGLLNTYRDMLTDAVVTQRDGRYCLPVKAEYKSKVPGMVHDASSTGLTLFIEPMAIVKLNNELRELFSEEKKEIEAVLSALSLQLSAHTFELSENVKILRKLDMIFAKALFSASLNGVEPVFSSDRSIDLREARHPLIEKDRVVPIDLKLGGAFDLLVITGPNTGGKTVSLKTAGLFTLMGQAGLHIPAGEGSVLGVFDEVYADIGDEQSIEQSLSTFSAHMKNIVHILEHADACSLCLFDELGAGTDPTEGAALAVAILNFLHNMKTRTIATTHYSELKVYALQTEGVENACCEFDVGTLRPTYRLLIGIPGKSNAFAISKKLGLPSYIIDEAEKQIAAEDERFEDLIQKLNDDRVRTEKSRMEAEAYQKEIAQLRARIRQKETRLDESRDQILRAAKEEASRILKDAKKAADTAIRSINKISDAHGLSAKEEAEAEREKLRAGIRKNETGAALKAKGPAQPVSAKKLRIGDGIAVTSMGGMKGTVSSLPDKDGNLFVQLGIMKSKVNVRDIELVHEAGGNGSGGGETKGAFGSTFGGPRKKNAGGSGSFSPKAMSVKPEVNLIGMTTDEAVPEMEKYLDDAYLAHLSQVRIVHGRGTGALRKAVHARLRKLGYVKDFRLGEFGEGDTGVTIVTFK